MHRLSPLRRNLTPCLATSRRPNEAGVALIIALMVMTVMTVLGLALILVAITETRVSANFRDASQALYAADAGVERSLQDLRLAADWNAILAGNVVSGFTDGAPAGQRTLQGGTQLDLSQTTNMVRCGKTSACTDTDMNAITAERPWGANNPRWQLYAYGPLNQLLPGGNGASAIYVIVWVADDPSENDNKPLEDGATPGNPGQGIITVLAHAYGPGGIRRMLEATIARTQANGQTGARILSWREVR